MDKFKQEIRQLHSYMRTLTIESGVKESKYDRFLSNLDELEDPAIEELYSWLNEIRTTEYFGVLEIKRLLPDHVWERYKQMGEEELREQVLLAERQKLLRKIWHGKKKPAKQKESAEAPDGGGVQPEE